MSVISGPEDAALSAQGGAQYLVWYWSVERKPTALPGCDPRSYITEGATRREEDLRRSRRTRHELRDLDFPRSGSWRRGEDLWTQPGDLCQTLTSLCRLTDDCDGLGIEESSRGRPKTRVVVHDEQRPVHGGTCARERPDLICEDPQ